VESLARSRGSDRPAAALDRLHTYCAKKFGHLLDKPLYAFHEHVIPRLALLLLVLLLPAEADRYSVDGYFRDHARR